MAFRSTRQKLDYRPDIDGLRAIAVSTVVLYHAGISGFSGGFVGVDIFFVISGFLITGIVWSELGKGSFSLQDFYVRRIRRIFPALFAVLFFCSIAAFLLLTPQDLEAFGKSLNATVSFYSNFHWVKNTNYFDGPAIEKPLLHTWSLSVEEQFYAVWPLALLFLSRTVPARRIPYVVLGLAILSLAFAENNLSGPKNDAFYLPWWRAWELLLGALLALTPLTLRPGRLSAALAGAGLAMIALAVALYSSSTRFPGISALLPCVGAALLIVSGGSSNPFSRILAIAPIRHIGLISYSLYLIHWPLFAFSHLVIGPELSLPLRLSLIFSSVALAHLSWRFVETPFRKAGFPKLQVFGAAAAAMGCLLLAGLSIDQSGGFPFRVNSKVLRFEAEGMNSSNYCRQIDLKEIVGDTCELGERRAGEGHGGSYDFVLWGDSHAGNFGPAVNILARTQKLSGLMLWKPGCHPFIGDPHAKYKCGKFNASVARWLASHPVKLAILAGRWQTEANHIREYIAQKDPSENLGGLAKTLDFLASQHVSVSVIDQVPEFPRDVKSCVVRAAYYGRDITSCAVQDAARFEERHQVLDGYFRFLRQRYSFSLASAADAICKHGVCNAMDGDDILMRDSNHMTERGSMYIMPYLDIPLLPQPAAKQAAAPGMMPAAAAPAPAL